MSADGAFMYWAGRRVEWQMLHPEFQKTFGFMVRGADVCREMDVHPMFPTGAEIDAVVSEINRQEAALA